MTYRSPSRDDGFLVVDAMIAIALGALFLGFLASGSLGSMDILRRSIVRAGLIEAYELHALDFSGMNPGEEMTRTYGSATVSSSVVVRAVARWFGNERVEKEVQIVSGGVSVNFREVRSYVEPAATAGTPMCSVNFGDVAGIVPVSLPVSPGIPLASLAVRDGVAYLSADSVKQSDPDFLLVDIRDPAHARLLSSLNTGPGLAQFAIAGAYVYAAAPSAAAQLHVIRIDTPTSIRLYAKYALPLPQASTSPPLGTAAFYAKGKVYLGTERWDGNEFSIIDVSDPSSPSWTSGLDTGSKINSIYVRGDASYIAASDQNQMRWVDVRGGTPSVIQGFSPSGWQRQEGKAVTSFENYLDMGRTSGGFDIAADPELFEWATSSVPTTANIPGGVYGMIRDRARLFVITHAAGREFAVFGPGLSTTTALYYSLPSPPQAITCDQGIIYILASNAPIIYEITFKKA